MILDVGCGKNKTPGAIGMDKNPLTGADVIHDLGEFPYPFPDNHFDEVVGIHVVEHVPDPLRFMEELWRITKPGGLIRLATPHYTNPTWASDLTHRNHLNSYSFECFDHNRQLFDFYTSARLLPVHARVTLANIWRYLGIQMLVNLDNGRPSLRFFRRIWEYYFSSIMRGKDLYFEFEVVKAPFSPE